MSIGPIEIQMYADVARLRADMEQSRKLVGDAMGGIQRAVDLARVAFVALAGAASVNALRGMVGSAIEGAAALKDLQQQTGASVAALNQMGAVGKLSDTSLQTIGGAMNKLSKAMAGSNEDSRGAAAAIKALGIDYDTFAKMAPDQRMQAVATAMAGFKDGAGKSAVAMSLWGKSGAELLPFMADMAEGVENVTQATAEQAEMADRYGDNLTRLRVSGGEWAKELGLGLLPVLDETTQALMGVMNGSGGLREQIAKLSADGTLARWGRDAVTAFSYVVDGIQYTIRFLSVMGEYIGATVADAVQMFGGVGEAIKRALSGDFAGAVSEMQAISTRTAAINADLAASVNAQWDAKTMGQNLRERIAQIQTAGAEAKKAGRDLNFKDTSGAAAGGQPANAFAADQDAAKAWAKAFEDFTKMADAATAKTADLTKAQARLVEYLGSTAYTNASEGMRQVALSAAYAAVAAEQLGAAEAAQLRWLEESGAANVAALDALDKTVLGLQAQVLAQLEANAQAGMSEIAVAGLAAAKLEEAAATAEQRAQWAETAGLGDDLVAKYRDQAKALQALADAKRAGAFAADQGQQNAAGQKAIDDYLKSGTTTDLAAGFDKASQSLGVFVQLFGTLVDAQEKYNAARTAAAGDQAQLAEIEAHHQRAQISSYGSLAGAAKGFFKEHTAGYKAMEAAEKTFRAIELGMAIKNAMEKIGLIGITTGAVAAGQAGETAAVAAGETARNAAKVPGVFMAFMSALGPWGLAAAGAAIAAVGLSASGGVHSGSLAPTNSGTGTVLGDPGAQSESISKSLDLLGDVNTLTMRYSAQMLTALRSIDASISGISTLIVQGGGLGAALGDVQTGMQTNRIGGALRTLNSVLMGKDLVSQVPVIGDMLGKIIDHGGAGLAKLFGSSTSVLGQGISGGPQALGDIITKGFQAALYADIETKDKFAGLTTSTSVSTQSTAASSEITQQFGMVFAAFADTMRAAAGPLGESLGAVQQRLASFVVDVGRIDLTGLTGQEISDKLTAVFGAEGDKIAKAALPGLEAFQLVGEGYLETVTRVATSTDLVRGTLDALGQSTAAVSGLMINRATAALDLIDKFGGADKFTSLTASYLEAYYSEAERAALTTKQLTTALAGMGLTLPKSRDEFRRLVEAQDLSTDAGRSAYANLLGLADVFAKLSDATTAASSTIVDEIRRLRGLSADAGTQSAAQLQARFGIATAQARAGDAGALSSLPEISKALETASAATATRAIDAARMRAWLANSLTETLTLLGLPIPAFAAGGMFGGGLALVGEQGPELVATGPARIYNAGQTQAMLSGSGGDSTALLAELQALRAEVASLRADSQAGDAAIASYTRRTADYLDRVIDGADAVRTTT